MADSPTPPILAVTPAQARALAGLASMHDGILGLQRGAGSGLLVNIGTVTGDVIRYTLNVSIDEMGAIVDARQSPPAVAGDGPAAYATIQEEATATGYSIRACCVACGWDSNGELYVIDAYSAAWPPGPRGNRDWIRVRDDEDPEAHDVGECGRCRADFSAPSNVSWAIPF